MNDYVCAEGTNSSRTTPTNPYKPPPKSATPSQPTTNSTGSSLDFQAELRKLQEQMARDEAAFEELRRNPPSSDSGGGNGGGSNVPNYAGGPAQSVPPPSCMKLAWAPSDQYMANCFTSRTSYVANGPGGQSAVQITAPGGGAKITGAYCTGAIPGAQQQKPQAARICVQAYFPNDGSSFLTAGGRLALGLSVNSGQSVPNGYPGDGGTPPHQQNSANIRINKSGGTPMVYSYHLDRKCGQIAQTPGYLARKPDGTIRRSPDYYHYGCGSTLKSPFPVNQWFTMCLDVVVNTYDANGKPLANGLSQLSMYDNSGKLLGTAGFNNVVYSRDPSGFIRGLALTEKWNSETGNKGAVSNTYYRNYQVFFPDKSKPGC